MGGFGIVWLCCECFVFGLRGGFAYFGFGFLVLIGGVGLV